MRGKSGDLDRAHDVMFRLFIAAVGVLLCFGMMREARAVPSASTTTRTLSLQPAQPAAAETYELVKVQPPLSITESCLMLKQIIGELEARKTPPEPARVEQIDRMLHAVNFYVERLDRANPTLPGYTWSEIASQKVPDTSWRNFSFELKSPVADVSAVSLRAHHGDIEMSQLVAVDANGTQWRFDQPMLMTDGEAHVEICLLPLPMRLRQVKLTCRQNTEKAARYPRLIVQVGISSEPEYARQARYYLQMARAELAARDPRKSAGHLRKTFDLLQSFEQSRTE